MPGQREGGGAKLFIHRNTLRQRFDKITKVTGITCPTRIGGST